MSDYGSFHNNLYANMESPEPEVGMGATELGWTDRHAYTIIEVISPKKIVVQRDNAIRTDKNGMSDAQSYSYEANPQGTTYTLTKRKNGSWKVMKGDAVFLIGIRKEYYDYSF